MSSKDKLIISFCILFLFIFFLFIFIIDLNLMSKNDAAYTFCFNPEYAGEYFLCNEKYFECHEIGFLNYSCNYVEGLNEPNI